MEFNRKSWADIIRILIFEKKPVKKTKNYWVYKEVKIENLVYSGNPFEICNYKSSSMKLKSLYSKYYWEPEWEDVLNKNEIHFYNLNYKENPSYITKRHCLESIELDHCKKIAKVKINYSDFLRKFLPDDFFIQELLINHILGDYKVIYEIKELSLRTLYFYSYLNYVYQSNPALFKRILESDNEMVNNFLTLNFNDKGKTLRMILRQKKLFQKTKCFEEVKNWYEYK